MAHEDSHHTLQSLYNFAKEELGPLVIGGGILIFFQIQPSILLSLINPRISQNRLHFCIL